MKTVALLSGGKDSCYNMMECQRHGHEIVVLANLYPCDSETMEIDSFMFQSAGFNMITTIAECMELPLIRHKISKKSIEQQLQYVPNQDDEVEDMYELLAKVKEMYPEVEAVSCGAIFSTYQRIRVENVCTRLGLTSLTYLWRREQRQLLEDMVHSGVDAILVKVSSMGLQPRKHLGKSIKELFPYFDELHEKFQFHICGEGGEYETLTLDCPLFKKKIIIDSSSIKMHSNDMIAPVALLDIHKCRIVSKTDQTSLLVDISSLSLSSSEHENIVLDHAKSSIPTKNEINKESISSNMIQEMTLPEVKAFRRQLHFSGVTSGSTNLSMEQDVASIMKKIKVCLASHQATLDDVVFVHIVLKDMKQFSAMNQIYSTYFGNNPPSRSCVGAPLENTSILMDFFVLKDSGIQKFVDSKVRTVLHVKSISSWAPSCIGPYSQVNLIQSSFIYLAGQIGLVPEKMSLLNGPLDSQLQQAFKNNARVLDAMDSSLRHVVFGIIFLNQQQYSAEEMDIIKKSSYQHLLHNAQEIDRFETNSVTQGTVFDNDSKLDILHETTSSSSSSSSSSFEKSNRNNSFGISPSLQVVTGFNLPREAMVEIECIALTNKAIQSLHIQSLEIHDNDCNDFFYRGSRVLTFSSRIFCMGFCSVGFMNVPPVASLPLQVNQEQQNVDQVARFLLKQVHLALECAQMKWDQLLHLRIFYKTKYLSQLELNQALVILAKKYYTCTPPATTFIPTNGMENNAFLVAQLTAHDLDKIETEMWLRKLI